MNNQEIVEGFTNKTTEWRNTEHNGCGKCGKLILAYMSMAATFFVLVFILGALLGLNHLSTTGKINKQNKTLNHYK
jgi:hypothetical protein